MALQYIVRVSSQFAATVNAGTQIALRDPFFNLIGILTVTDKYTPDKVSMRPLAHNAAQITALCLCAVIDRFMCAAWCYLQGKEALNVYGTTDRTHPAVDYLMNEAGPINLGGRFALSTVHPSLEPACLFFPLCGRTASDFAAVVRSTH
jgi:ATP sulfurylase